VLRDDGGFARIVLDVNGPHAEIDSRPSDAIALAVRTKCSIFVDELVIDKAGVTLDTESAPESENGEVPEGESLPQSERPDEDRLSVFRDFINSLDIDDLGKQQGEGPSKQ